MTSSSLLSLVSALALSALAGFVALSVHDALASCASPCSCSIGWDVNNTADCDVADENKEFVVETTDDPNVETQWASRYCGEWNLVQVPTQTSTTDNLENGSPGCDPDSVSINDQCDGFIHSGTILTKCWGTLDLTEDEQKPHGEYMLNAWKNNDVTACNGGWTIIVKPFGGSCD